MIYRPGGHKTDPRCVAMPERKTTDQIAEGQTPVATDYDTPRKTDEELAEDSLEELKARRVDASSGAVDADEAEAAESFELPGADLSNEELSVRVLPRQAALKATRAGNGSARPRAAALDDRDIPDRRIFACLAVRIPVSDAGTDQPVRGVIAGWLWWRLGR